MHDPKMLVAFVIVAAVCLVLGYAFRGAIRRELALAHSDATAIVARLEKAVQAGDQAVQLEVQKLIADLKAQL